MNANDTNKTYEVPETNLPALTEKLEKAVRKSAKLGVGNLTFSVGTGVDVPYYWYRDADHNRRRTRFDAEKHGDLVEATHAGKIEYIRYFPVTISGSTPALAGWQFVATLQHLEADGETINLLRTVPGVDADLPHNFRTATPENCDHCNKSIKTRKETFVVRETATGKFSQIGRNCLADFLGGQDPHAVAKALELLLSACDAASSSSEDEGFGGGGHGPLRFPLRTFLAVTAMLVRTEGWLSRSKARIEYGDTSSSTASLALEYLSPPPRDSQARADWEAFRAKHPVTAEDIETADKALEFARTDLADRPRA